MTLNTILIKEHDFNTSEWSGGSTSQICIYPETSNYKSLDFKYRISSATVDLEKSEFTKLEGVHRFISPLDNNLRLTHDNSNFIELKPFEIYEFDGGIDTISFGKVRDFNLMITNGAKGNLESFYIESNSPFKKVISKKREETHYIVFTYNDEIAIKVGEELHKLSPMSALIIEAKDEEINIELKSNDSANIIFATVNL